MMKKRLVLLVLAAVFVLALPVQAADAFRLFDRAAGGMVRVGDTLYLADGWGRGIFRVEKGELTLVTGRQTPVDASGRPAGGYNDEDLENSAFSQPWGLIPWQEGLLVADTGNHAVRFLDLEEEQVYTAVGTGKAGFADGKGRKAAFDRPCGLAIDDQGLVYIADAGNHAIRTMDEQGRVKTLLGGIQGSALGDLKQTRLCEPTGLCWADGVLYIADTGNHRILALEDGHVRLVAGAPLTGDAAMEGDYLNGPADVARFSSPQGVAVGADGTVYVADTGNGAVRAIRNGYVTTLLRSENAATWPVAPVGLLADGNTLLVGDSFSRVVLQLDANVTAATFSDVPAGAYYARAVDFALANGLMNGTGAGKFSPAQTMTRGMVLTVLARQAGMDTSTGPQWYSAGLQWGLAAGVSDGQQPNAPISRQQLATMLYRVAGDPETDGSLAAFSDGHTAADYARTALCWAVETGILTGTTDGRLAPAANADRGQVAVMLMRFFVGN